MRGGRSLGLPSYVGETSGESVGICRVWRWCVTAATGVGQVYVVGCGLSNVASTRVGSRGAVGHGVGGIRSWRGVLCAV